MRDTALNAHHEIQGFFATTEGWAKYTLFVIVSILRGDGVDGRVQEIPRKWYQNNTKSGDSPAPGRLIALDLSLLEQ